MDGVDPLHPEGRSSIDGDRGRETPREKQAGCEACEVLEKHPHTDAAVLRCRPVWCNIVLLAQSGTEVETDTERKSEFESVRLSLNTEYEYRRKEMVQIVKKVTCR